MSNEQNGNEQELVDDDGTASNEPVNQNHADEQELDRQVEINRAALLERRRARQTGKSFGGKQIAVIFAVLAAGTAMAVFKFAPGIFFGKSADDKDAIVASDVDLGVDKKPTKNGFNIDLSGFVAQPAKPATIDNTARDTQAQIAELQKKLDDLNGAPKDESLSKEAVNALVEKLNKDFNKRLADERKVMQEEAQRQRAADAARQQQAAEALAAREKLAADAEAARQKQAADLLQAASSKKVEEERKKQRESSSLVLDGSQEGVALAAGEGGSGGLSAVPGGGPGPSGGAGLKGSAPTGSQNQQFLASNADSNYVTTWAKSLAYPSKTIVQGTIISGVLETAIDTQLPGNIRAQVIEPVFSYDGSHILMPAGTVLIGTFNPEVEFEQKRVLIAWNRAITPDGDSIAIGGTGADLLGRSGTAGNVDNRYTKKIGAAVLISALTVAPAILSAKLAPKPAASTDDSGVPTVALNVGSSGSSGSKGNDPLSQVAEGVTEPLTDILSKFLDLPPVIRIAQGEEIRIFVNRDLVFR